MATMIPDLAETQLDDWSSQAEARLYRALRDGLPAVYVVLAQVGWILRKQDQRARDGETDLLVCHPDLGYLCIEVKGGGVGFDASCGEWYSIDRYGQKHRINNPAEQALRAKYSIRTKLGEHPRGPAARLDGVLSGHAVFFPDIGNVAALSRPDLPADLIGCAKDLQHIHRWIERAFEFWGHAFPGAKALGRAGVGLVREVFARSFDVPPLVAAQLAEQEARRFRLTKDQLRVLDLLRSHRRVAVSGGAGTGKTVLALEKARRLAAEGFRTLLTCYNRQLADHLGQLCTGCQNLEVMSFHQLCHRQVERANRLSGRDLVAEAKVTYPGTGLYEVQLPNALAYSLDIIPERYDAVVCDEGQDFREEFWVPLELMLADDVRSPFYVFYDDNQRLYTRAATFPIRDEPYSLTTNCRNTEQIHEFAYRRYKGVPVSPPAIPGEEIQFSEASGQEAQATKIVAHIVDLIARQGVAAADCVVLVADALNKAHFYNSLTGRPLPKPARWLVEGLRTDNTVLLETVQRFKGLESPIVFLWGLDSVEIARNEELLYVGMTRAKSMLVVVGRAETCRLLRTSW